MIQHTISNTTNVSTNDDDLSLIRGQNVRKSLFPTNESSTGQSLPVAKKSKRSSLEDSLVQVMTRNAILNDNM